MEPKRAYAWKTKRVVNWTPEMDAMLGTMPDAEIARRIGFSENAPRDRRVVLGIPTYRSTRAPTALVCANCGKPIQRKPRDLARSRRLFCSRPCADAGQKRRDSETLRYGPGWKNRRAEIRRRDKSCRMCGKTPEQNGAELQVHHLKPYRYGGTNHPTNLVALCESCHHLLEGVMTQVFDSIPIEVKLDGSSLTISVDNKPRWHGSVPGVVSPTKTGLIP